MKELFLLQGLEAQDLTSLSGSGDLTAQLLGDADDLGHQFAIGSSLLALAQLDVIHAAHTDDAAQG